MKIKRLLHFAAFFKLASLFSTKVDNKKVGVDNEKVGVDNKKALELDSGHTTLHFHISTHFNEKYHLKIQQSCCIWSRLTLWLKLDCLLPKIEICLELFSVFS